MVTVFSIDLDPNDLSCVFHLSICVHAVRKVHCNTCHEVSTGNIQQTIGSTVQSHLTIWVQIQIIFPWIKYLWFTKNIPSQRLRVKQKFLGEIQWLIVLGQLMLHPDRGCYEDFSGSIVLPAVIKDSSIKRFHCV